MEKQFSKIEISTIKSIAKNVAPYVTKKQKIEQQIAEVEEKVAEQIRKRAQEKIEKLEAEKASYQDIINSMNATVMRITGGFTTEQLVDCVKEGTGKMDEKGKEIMQTRYVLKYPETVVPVTESTDAEAPTTPEEAECPSHEAAQEEMPEELMAEQAEAAEENADADPFADDDPFNQ